MDVDARSSSRNIKRARQKSSSEFDEDDSDNDDEEEFGELIVDSIEEYLDAEIGLERVIQKIYPGVKSECCSSAKQSNKEIQFYSNASSDNTSGDVVSQSNSTSRSRSLPGRIRNISSDKPNGHPVGHNSKNGGKHLRIHSNVVFEEIEGNSTGDGSSSNGSCVDSPITDGTNTP